MKGAGEIAQLQTSRTCYVDQAGLELTEIYLPGIGITGM